MDEEEIIASASRETISAIPITEVFGVKINENVSSSEFIWIALIILLAYVAKCVIDLMFSYILEKIK